MKLKVGDKVRILSCTNGLGHSMGQYIGKITYVVKVYSPNVYRINIDNGMWVWGKSRLEKVKK